MEWKMDNDTKVRALVAIVLVAAALQGCGKSKAALEAERVAAENNQKQQQAALEAATQRANEFEQRTASAERRTSELASERSAKELERATIDAAASSKSELVASLKATAVATLKDPSSAQFRNISLKDESSTLCGEINAKNSFGGYVGYRPFVATKGGAVIRPDDCGPEPQGGSYESQIAALRVRNQCNREINVYLEAARDGGC